MTAIEIARRLAGLNQTQDAMKAYGLALHESAGSNPAGELEAALYILQNGGDYRRTFTALCNLHRAGHFQSECLDVLTEAFYTPNVKLLKMRYEKNCRRLAKYPYLFRRDFPDFDKLPLRFYPFDDNGYVPYDRAENRFGAYVRPRRPVVSRNFFKNLENPILAQDVYSQYELEYLNDNVRKSEFVGRENHIYLHYADWDVFCAWLQVLNLRPLLEDEKFVFLIGDEISR